MSIGDAKKFILRGMSDTALRDQLNEAKFEEQLAEVLAQYQLKFTFAEFDEAFSNLLTRCQFEEQAEELSEFRMWWEFLLQLIPGAAEKAASSCEAGGSCASRGSCSGCH